MTKRRYAPGTLRRLTNRQGGRCFYCTRRMGRKGEFREATVDHVLPVASGGANEHSNLVAACRPCNAAKGALSAADFLAVLAEFQREEAA